MPEYLHPGVYIEEQPSPQTIEGVSTSTAGFVGITQKGPTRGLPQLVTSFAEFSRRYGSFLPEDPWGTTRFLAYAVEGFFNNGGKRVYITRIVGDGAEPSTLTLNDGFVTRLAADTPSDLSASNVVRLLSLRGVQVGSTLRFREVIAGTDVQDDRTVVSFDPGLNIARLNNPLTQRFTRAGATVTLQGVTDAPDPAAGTPSLRIDASSEGTWGRGLQILISDSKGAVGLTNAFSVDAETVLVPVDLAFAAAGGPAAGATEIELADASDLAEGDMVEFSNGTQTEQREISGIETNTISWDDGLIRDYTAAGSTIQLLTVLRAGAANPQVTVEDAGDIETGNLVRISQGTNSQVASVSAVAGDLITLDTAAFPIGTTFSAGAAVVVGNAGRSGETLLNLRSSRNFYPGAVIEVNNGVTKTYHTVESITGNGLNLTGPLAGDIPGGAAVQVVEFTLSITDPLNNLTERYDRLSMDPELDNFVETVVNSRSNLVQVEALGSTRAAPFNIPSTATGAFATLAGGDDGGVPGPDDYIGADNGVGQRTGIQALADIDEVSILAVPGISDAAVQMALIIQCEELKDRFAVLDPALNSTVGSGREDDVIVQRSNHDTTYAAFYYPWLRINDFLYPDRRSGSLVPPSGHVVGIYARTDVTRGVQKAPANEVVRGVIGLEYLLGDRDQDILNPAPNNINVIRDFRSSGRGIRVWGARVITSDNAWKYVPVRRLFIFLEESMDQGLQWSVFEPNGEDLWARVRQTLVGFLRTIWLNGGLAGVTEEEAFFVRCDRTTMTEDDISNGRLIVLVGVAPLRPAEFVIIRIGQKTLEAVA